MRTTIKSALRSLRHSPGLVVVVLLTFTLGIGANTSIFSIVYGMLLRPFPYHDPDRLVRITTHPMKAPGNEFQLSLADFEDFARELTSVSALGAYWTTRVNLLGDDDAVPVELSLLTPGVLPTLGVSPQIGRNFTADEDRPGGDVFKVLISDNLWTRRYARDPAIIGKTLRTASSTYTIIGVMPPEFTFPARSDLWAPVQTEFAIRKEARPNNRAFRSYATIARLKREASMAQAQAEVASISQRLRGEFAVANGEVAHRVRSLREVEVQRFQSYLVLLLAAVGMVSLVCCANVANLLLARAAAKQRQVTIHAALGAGRLQLIALLLTEALLLSLGGGLLGTLLASAVIRYFPSLIPEPLPLWMKFELNPTILGFCLAVSVLAALLAGVAPALFASRVKLVDVLREGSRGSGRGGRMRSALVVGEVALAVMLLAGAGWLVRSFQKLLSVDPGFAPERVMTVSVSPYRTGTNAERIAKVGMYYREVLRRLEEIPGVIAAGGTDNFPFTRQRGERTTLNIEAKGEGLEAKSTRAPASFIDVTPRYFEAMGIPMLEGRAFTERDDQKSPLVIILSERAAQALFPGQSALGRMVRAGSPGYMDPWATVVGVVGNVKQQARDDQKAIEFYYPYTQWGLGTAHLAIRVQGDPEKLEAEIRRVVSNVDPETAVNEVRTLHGLIDDSLWQQRLWSLMLAAFAAITLLLALLGVYGVTAYAVRSRSREIGIRVALGSTPSRVVGLFGGRSLALIGLGCAVGLAGALVASRTMESLLFGVARLDPLVLLGTPLLLLAGGGIAALIPALWAARVDPNLVLR